VAGSGMEAMSSTISKPATPARRFSLEHPTRTAVATLASLLVARVCHLPEPYWAPITTIVITQSSLGSAWQVSKQRLAGTLMGAVVGSAMALPFAPHQQVELRATAFAIGVFLLGIVCQLVRVDRSGYRFGGVTLAIVLMIPRTGPAWIIGVDRFLEVSIGIAMALLFAKVWPEKPESLTSSR
jgi:uncharacterized membrane protein YccC